jgi:hypothetical protein
MAMSEDIAHKLNPPIHARAFLPKWYIDSTAFIGGKMLIGENGINKDLKLCIPFLDAMTAGYCVELSCDVYVERDGNKIGFYWHEEPFPITSRPEGIAANLPRPAGHIQQLHAWSIHWASMTPPGYSALFCHPLNRYDLPFITTSGIVDTDKYHPGGEIPFFLKEDFTGVIPAGTPIVQIIPLKRDAWSSKNAKLDKQLISRLRYAVSRVLIGGYSKMFWVKKQYE